MYRIGDYVFINSKLPDGSQYFYGYRKVLCESQKSYRVKNILKHIRGRNHYIIDRFGNEGIPECLLTLDTSKLKEKNFWHYIVKKIKEPQLIELKNYYTSLETLGEQNKLFVKEIEKKLKGINKRREIKKLKKAQ